MANVPGHLGTLDVGVSKEVVVQMFYEASNRLHRRINFVRVVSHNIHRDSATISRHLIGGKETHRTECAWRCSRSLESFQNAQESCGNRERRAALQRRANTGLPPRVNFWPENSGCFVAQ